jgi:hypothetical protein
MTWRKINQEITQTIKNQKTIALRLNKNLMQSRQVHVKIPFFGYIFMLFLIVGGIFLTKNFIINPLAKQHCESVTKKCAKTEAVFQDKCNPTLSMPPMECEKEKKIICAEYIDDFAGVWQDGEYFWENGTCSVKK